MRLDTGEISYRGEDTAPNITVDCRDKDCDQHYVVRLDGTWVRGFHNEKDAREFAEACEALIDA
jgi:hypothetical protein